LSQQWNESIIIPIHEKGVKTAVNYRGISLLSTAYKILSNILLARLIPYVNEVIDHQCGFRLNRSTKNQIFYIRQILEKKWEYNGKVHQLFIDFQKAHESVKREVLYHTLLEFGIPKKLVRLINCQTSTLRTRTEMVFGTLVSSPLNHLTRPIARENFIIIEICLNETYSKVNVGKLLSDKFPIQNGLKQRDALSPLLFSFALEYAIRKVLENQISFELNVIHQILVYLDDVNLLDDSINTIKGNKESLLRG
jgi:hypothetical protein